jgi:hypothetical protein
MCNFVAFLLASIFDRVFVFSAVLCLLDTTSQPGDQTRGGRALEREIGNDFIPLPRIDDSRRLHEISLVCQNSAAPALPLPDEAYLLLASCRRSASPSVRADSETPPAPLSARADSWDVPPGSPALPLEFSYASCLTLLPRLTVRTCRQLGCSTRSPILPLEFLYNSCIAPALPHCPHVQTVEVVGSFIPDPRTPSRQVKA